MTRDTATNLQYRTVTSDCAYLPPVEQRTGFPTFQDKVYEPGEVMRFGPIVGGKYVVK